MLLEMRTIYIYIYYSEWFWNVLQKQPKIMREKPCRIISLFGIVQFLCERKGYEVPLLSCVYSGWSLWVSDNNNSSDRTQGRLPSFPLRDCIFTNLMVWIKYGQSSEIFLPCVYFIYIFPLTWPIHYFPNLNLSIHIHVYIFFPFYLFIFSINWNKSWRCSTA